MSLYLYTYSTQDVIEPKINKKDSLIIEKTIKNTNDKLYELIKNKILNRQGSNFNVDDIIEFDKITSTIDVKKDDYDQEKMNFLIENYQDKKSLIGSFIEITEIKQMIDVKHYPKYQFATETLNKYGGDICVVCDSNFDHDKKLSEKTKRIEEIKNIIGDRCKGIINELEQKKMDPFEIKGAILADIEKGVIDRINGVKNDIANYIEHFKTSTLSKIVECYNEQFTHDEIKEYSELIAHDVTISDEDLNIVKKMVSEYIGKEIAVKRENGHCLKIVIDDMDLLNSDLQLSTGEQNFISLCFEFIKIKNDNNSKIIMIDDPISSFDSIYKNKVIYMLLKIIANKPIMILTHNIDVLKIASSQGSMFNLYIMVNKNGADNGFIKVSNKDSKMICDVSQVTSFLRTIGPNDVVSEKRFMISISSFLRSYANIIGQSGEYNKLCKLLHNSEEIVDIGSLFRIIMNNNNLTEHINVSSDDIINELMDGSRILLSNDYSLLNKALVHNLRYSALRLRTEKVLTDKFNPTLGSIYTVGEVIDKTLTRDQYPEYRVELMSKKTLMNEFNHFESDLNIFLPAIDIADKTLDDEINAVDQILEDIKKLQ